jgi:hypothetical protein
MNPLAIPSQLVCLQNATNIAGASKRAGSEKKEACRPCTYPGSEPYVKRDSAGLTVTRSRNIYASLNFGLRAAPTQGARAEFRMGP